MTAERGSIKSYVGAVTLFFVLLVAGSFSAHAWNYRYDSAWDVGIWTNNGIDRFRYWYGVTAWEQCSQWGGWKMLGNYGWSPVARYDANPANFIGDGTYRNLTNGWWFAYAASGNYSAWKRNADGKVRFSYAYGTGQWNDVYTPTNSWAPIGTGNMSSTFIGDGTYRNVGNGWIFGYYAGGDASYWKRAADGVMRFAYSYIAGQWNDVYHPTPSTDIWAGVGTGSIGPAFIGDGAYRYVGNGWLFAYSASGDYCGWQSTAFGYALFSYSFGAGQWFDLGFTNTWSVLSDTAVSPAFVGDGASRDLGNGWSYRWVMDASDPQQPRTYGFWHNNNPQELAEFWYDYSTGEWLSQGAYAGFYVLAGSGLSADFVGDGAWHGVGTTWANGTTWYYKYSGSDWGTWYNNNLGFAQFAYAYDTGQWYEQGIYGGRQQLSYGFVSPDFVGNGYWHDIGTTGNDWSSYSWQYLFNGQYGYWYNNNFGLCQYRYDYMHGDWATEGFWGGWQPMGDSGLSAAFVGDGQWHTLYTTGAWPSYTWRYFFGPAWDPAGAFWDPVYHYPEYGEWRYNFPTGQWYKWNPDAGSWEPHGDPQSMAMPPC
jgi:hypothetical protein